MSDTTEDAIRRADRAAAMLSDPLFTEAWDGINARILELWATSDAHDAEARERLFLAQLLLKQLRMVFVSHIENGKIAADRVATMARMSAISGAL